jgi:hypothetical protein
MDSETSIKFLKLKEETTTRRPRTKKIIALTVVGVVTALGFFALSYKPSVMNQTAILNSTNSTSSNASLQETSPLEGS